LGFVPEYLKNRNLQAELQNPQKMIDGLKQQLQMSDLRDAVRSKNPPARRIRGFHHSGPEILGSARDGKPRSFFLCLRNLGRDCAS